MRFLLPEKFVNFFSEIYQERWPALLASLLSAEPQVARFNLFSREKPFTLDSKEIPRGEDGLLTHYIMDPASIAVAQALNVQPGDRVLDMCAAPGGKTLILAEALREEGELLANEISEARRERLKKVIQQYIPREIRERVWVTGKEGGKFALIEKAGFDRILVDAPCSGERHLLQNQKELMAWTSSRSEKLAQRQYALLTAALLACRSGGEIVYSTCSISPLENDGVIKKLLHKKEDQFELLECPLPIAGSERTEFGIQIFPDRASAGPIFFAKLKRH